MLTASSSTTKLKTSKGTLILVGFVFIFLITSVAVGLRTSNAALPVSAGRGCHGGEGDDGSVTCTSTSSSTVTTSTVSTSTQTTQTTTTTITSSQGPVDPVQPEGRADCGALNGISYQALAGGTTLTIAFNGNGQMTYTVPSEKSFSWNWYFVPANGQSTTALGQQITNAMWSSGHGQNFSFFVAKLNGVTGLVLQTDYALSQACS
jgi:hypothetical protein